MGTTYDDFLYALRMRESSDNYSLVNTLDFLGAYQFGEGALVDLGFVRADSNYHDNDYSGGWTGLLGIDSKNEFLASKTAQDAAADMWFPLVWKYLTAIGADTYLGHVVDGTRITASGLLAGAHLLGSGAVLDWLESDGTLALSDAYGTPIAEYIDMFAGYTMPFDTGEATLDDIADLLAALPTALQDRIEAIHDEDGSLFIGNDDADRIAGDTLKDVIAGGGGNDTLLGAGRGDALLGGDGSDRIKAGAGYDLVIGGNGRDELIGQTGNDYLRGDNGDDELYGGADNDRLAGGDDDDLLAGQSGDDTLYGGAGRDLLRGNAGADKLYGQAGRDRLLGLDGRDLLSGGSGNDRLIGGDNADVFVFKDGADHDVVVDFELDGRDRIRLAGVDSISDFTDLMANHATQVGADVVIETDAGETLTILDTDLDALNANDFLF